MNVLTQTPRVRSTFLSPIPHFRPQLTYLVGTFPASVCVRRAHTSIASAKDPFAVFIQAEWQRQLSVALQDHSVGMMLHLDSTGQLNEYGCPLFAFIYGVRTRLVPLKDTPRRHVVANDIRGLPPPPRVSGGGVGATRRPSR